MSDRSPPRTKIFVSYSHVDSESRGQLEKHLKTLDEDDNIWIDIQNIPTGATWRGEIEHALAAARGAVLLITVDFVTSDFITQYELPNLLAAAEEVGVRIVPVHVKPCNIPESLMELQAVNLPEKTLTEMQPGEQDRIWLQVLNEIKSILSGLILVTYSDKDKDDVERVLSLLESEGLAIDRAEWKPSGMETANSDVMKKVKKRDTALIFVGRDGLGPWESSELREFLKDKSKKPKRIVTAILPHGTDPGDLFPQLVPNQIKLKSPVDDLGKISLLWRLITKTPWPGPEPARRRFSSSLPDSLRQEAEIEGPLKTAINNLVRQLPRGDHFTIFLGSGACMSEHPDSSQADQGSDHHQTKGQEARSSSSPLGELQSYRVCDVTQSLLEEIGLNGRDFLPPLDVVGSYYETRHDEWRLESRVHDLIGYKYAEIPPAHSLIAKLLKRLEANDEMPRLIGESKKKKHPRLIVTTNFDLLMERALLEAGLPFTRIVQHRSGSEIYVNEYNRVELNGRTATISTADGEKEDVDLDDLGSVRAAILSLGKKTFKNPTDESGNPGTALDTDIKEQPDSGTGRNSLCELPLSEFTPPYLYKFHGSEDISGSCAISIDQYFRFVRNILRRKIVPQEIEAYLTTGQVLFLGYGLFDPDFRVIAYTLLHKKAPEEKKEEWRYAIQLPPEQELADAYRRAELNLWNNLKAKVQKVHSIEVLEGSCEGFLEQLVSEISR